VFVQLPGALGVALGKGEVDPLAGLGQLLPPQPRSRARLRHPCPAFALGAALPGMRRVHSRERSDRCLELARSVGYERVNRRSGMNHIIVTAT
jgi:hypothetical protein